MELLAVFLVGRTVLSILPPGLPGRHAPRDLAVTWATSHALGVGVLGASLLGARTLGFGPHPALLIGPWTLVLGVRLATLPGAMVPRHDRPPLPVPTWALLAVGGLAITEALARSAVAGDDVDFAFMGQVVQAGAGQVPARQAAHTGGIPLSVPSTALNKACLSGLNAIVMAHRMIVLGEAEVVVAGGMESMTNAPYLLDKARGGYRLDEGAA